MSILPLSTWLTQNPPLYSDSDGRWRRFVVDYTPIIIQNSTVRTTSNDSMNIGQFNMIGYLRANGLPTWLDWIVYVINNIANDIEFESVTQLFVPNPAYIKVLYQLYQTSAKLQVKAVA